MARTSASAPAGYVDASTQYGQILLDVTEQVPDLMWPLSVQVYAKMRRYPTLQSVLAAYTLPLRRAGWVVNGEGCRPKAVSLVADDLGLPVKGQDAPGVFRRRGISWPRHLRMAMLHLTYGHMPFAHGFEFRDDGLLHMSALAERMPATISEIDVNDSTGDLVSARQFAATKTGLQAPELKAADLTWHVHDREGSSWFGTSLLRSAYAPWLLAMEMWRVHATGNRRQGMGTPVAEAVAGSNPTPEQMAAAQAAASAARVGETGGAAMPPGFVLRFKGVEGSLPDTLGFIRYLDQQMAAMALANALTLGHDAGLGSGQTLSAFVDLLMFNLQSVGDDTAATETADTARHIVDVNFGEDEAVPQIECVDVGADQEITAESIKALLDSGALSADPRLEEYLRKRYGLPARDDSAAPAPRLLSSVPTPAAPAAAAAIRRGRGRANASAVLELRRGLTRVENAAKTDFEKVQEQWQSALDKLVDDWGPVTQSQIDDLVGQVEDAVRADDRTLLPAMAADSSDGADLLAAAMAAAAVEAQAEMRDEAQRQGVEAPAGDVDQQRIDDTAAAIAAILAGGLAAAAARKALVVWGAGSTASDVGTAVRTHLEGLTDASLRESLGGGITAGQNTGRLAVLKAGTAPETLAASEILDANTCETCADIDGHVYDTVDDAELDYALGGYAACLGGMRCRGILVAVWDASTIEKAA